MIFLKRLQTIISLAYKRRRESIGRNSNRYLFFNAIINLAVNFITTIIVTIQPL